MVSLPTMNALIWFLPSKVAGRPSPDSPPPEFRPLLNRYRSAPVERDLQRPAEVDGLTERKAVPADAGLDRVVPDRVVPLEARGPLRELGAGVAPRLVSPV